MSILIKGMVMPQCCGECKFMVDRWCYASEDAYFELNKRHPDCPLVEVPTPHGRLIDENWLFSFISTNNSLGATHYGCLTKEEIQLAPTVIESEEKV